MSRCKRLMDSCVMPAFIIDQKNLNFRGAMTINIGRFIHGTNYTTQNKNTVQTESKIQAKLVKKDADIKIGNLKKASAKRSFAENNLTIGQFIANKKQVVAPVIIAPKSGKKNKKQRAKNAENHLTAKNSSKQVEPAAQKKSNDILQTSKPTKKNTPAKVSKVSKTVKTVTKEAKTKTQAKTQALDWKKNITIVHPEMRVSKSNNGLCIHNKNVKLCPACNPDAYLLQRIFNVIENAFKRLNCRRPQNMIALLGVQNKEEILHLFKTKMHNWNRMNPRKIMTETNINIDHIRPIYEFKRLNENMHFANHISNLQPLLKEDDAFKNCKWSKDDEFFWQENIAGKKYSNIYYPKQLFQPSVGRITK
jgi:gas vesicle protein